MNDISQVRMIASNNVMNDNFYLIKIRLHCTSFYIFLYITRMAVGHDESFIVSYPAILAGYTLVVYIVVILLMLINLLFVA